MRVSPEIGSVWRWEPELKMPYAGRVRVRRVVDERLVEVELLDLTGGGQNVRTFPKSYWTDLVPA